MFPFVVHIAACCACVLIGYRLSIGIRQASQIDPLDEPSPNLPLPPPEVPVVQKSRGRIESEVQEQLLRERPYWPEEQSGWWNGTSNMNMSNGSRVGRHGILIRDNPHPDPYQVVLAHEVVSLLQEAQRRVDGIWPQRTIIAITTTVKRTFQAMHMNGIVGSLKQARGRVLWIVVEGGGGGKTSDTTELLEKSGLEYVHLEWNHPVEEPWHLREKAELEMREVAIK